MFSVLCEMYLAIQCNRTHAGYLLLRGNICCFITVRCLRMKIFTALNEEVFFAVPFSPYTLFYEICSQQPGCVCAVMLELWFLIRIKSLLMYQVDWIYGFTYRYNWSRHIVSYWVHSNAVEFSKTEDSVDVWMLPIGCWPLTVGMWSQDWHVSRMYDRMVGRCWMFASHWMKLTPRRHSKLHLVSASMTCWVKLVLLWLSFSPLPHFTSILVAAAGEGLVCCTF